MRGLQRTDRIRHVQHNMEYDAPSQYRTNPAHRTHAVIFCHSHSRQNSRNLQPLMGKKIK
uniref:Uncharacterized protein n=1 Tax=Anguilla anguilla TaxID=7936 RepID=A0A0E9SQ44_ANGAN